VPLVSQALNPEYLPYDDDYVDPITNKWVEGQCTRKSLPWVTDWAKGIQQTALALIAADKWDAMRCKYVLFFCPLASACFYVASLCCRCALLRVRATGIATTQEKGVPPNADPELVLVANGGAAGAGAAAGAGGPLAGAPVPLANDAIRIAAAAAAAAGAAP
jgi:hypothetical protein